MSETRHTTEQKWERSRVYCPGEKPKDWLAHADDDGREYPVCFINTDDHYAAVIVYDQTEEGCNAKAELIVSAPALRRQRDELLHLCRQVATAGVCFCADRIECGGHAPCWHCRVRAAIAAAEVQP
jgi:hypothetical protein